MDLKLMVSGNIISELSEKIPSNIVALNELVKNSYDAGAKKVNITLSTSSKELIIEDDGSGMDEEDINTLLHISKSTKRYGTINKHNRITQGSKGLGFLAGFKFGKTITWKTKKTKGLSFTLNYDQIKNANDISECAVTILQEDSINQGTTIVISLDDYCLTTLEKYFTSEKHYKKLLKSFDDNDFLVFLHVDDIIHSNEEVLALKENAKDSQLYHVLYNSNEQVIKYKYNDYEVLRENFPFTSSEYSVDIELIIFQFQPYGKKKVDSLFLGPSDDLSPIIYINSNLFDNYDLFNPAIMKNVKTAYVLNQMIGYIRLKTSNQMLDFNPDRTHFLQNSFTDSIKEFLLQINKKIQELGAQYKNHLMDFDILTTNELPSAIRSSKSVVECRKYIVSDFAFRDKVKIDILNNAVRYSLFGKEITAVIKKEKAKNETNASSRNNTRDNSQNTSGGNQSPVPSKEEDNTSTNDDTSQAENDRQTEAFASSGAQNPEKHDAIPSNTSIPATINLNCHDRFSLKIPTPQIDLREYIASVYDSKGNSVSKQDVTFTVDGMAFEIGILPSVIIPSEKEIGYCYQDKTTGSLVKTIFIKFEEPQTKVSVQNSPAALIQIPSPAGYQIGYNSNVERLITQINQLDLDQYLEVIACSLRTIFEYDYRLVSAVLPTS